MKEYHPESIRNITLVGHGGSGKTTLTENLLYLTGEINRIGTVEDGNTVSDYAPYEIERQISIAATPLHLEWENTKINVLDTPGYSDFVGQVVSCLHVADLAISVVKSMEGVEVGTETTWDLIKKKNIPAAVIINKIDNEHSNFFSTVGDIKKKLSSDATVITFPVEEGIQSKSVVDVIKMKMFTYGESGSKQVVEADIPAKLKDKAEKLHQELMEKIAESDEALMNKYFEEGALSEDELQKGIKASINSNALIPIFAISCNKGVGFNDFLSFAVKYFPSPLDRKSVKGELNGKSVDVVYDSNGEPALQVFKSLSEAHIGELSVFKVISGTITPGLDLQNVTRNKMERIGQILLMNGKNRKEVGKMFAGDIGAVVKLKDTHTSDTLTSKNYSVVFKPIEFPAPLIRDAIKPRSKGDEDKISTGLHTMHEEDPTLAVQFDPELSQTIISGQGELQLNLATKMLKDRYNVEVDLVEPRIPYRETITKVCTDAEYKHKKQSGGRGQYGHVHLKLEPQERGKGFEFVDAIVGGVVPGRFIPAVEKGLNEILVQGILTGSRVIDIKVTLFDGTYHTVDSDEISFKIAASQAFKKGFMDASPIILEPIYDVSIKVPEEFMGDVMGDVSSRRGKILGMDSEGSNQVIRAKVPLAELYKYSTHLRSITSGRGVYSMAFSHYENVPKEIEGKVIEEYKKRKEEES
ncbi:MAG: elongation factor G [Ignavibacteriales bacterium]|nr:elongation factor G [Ignavibacteriales bacterium]